MVLTIICGKINPQNKENNFTGFNRKHDNRITLYKQAQLGVPHIERKNPGAGWVGGLVKTDFITLSGSHQSTA